MYKWDETIEFNRYTNLDSVEMRILEGLIESRTPHAMRLWNALADDSVNCLNSPNVQLLENLNDEEGWKKEIKRRRALVYQGIGTVEKQRVFFSPFIDDAEIKEGSRLGIFVDNIVTKNHLISTVLVNVEIIVHNKLVNIYTDADSSDNRTNPTKLMTVVNEDQEEEEIPWIRLQSRPTTMLKSALAELNGTFVDGVGQLQVNSVLNPKCGVAREFWDKRNYVGYLITFGTLMSGDSQSSAYGY